MAESNSSIVVSPEGYIYSGGKGIEKAMENGLPYSQNPYLGKFTLNAAKPDTTMSIRAEGRRSIADTMFTASMAKDFKNIWSQGHRINDRMYQAAPEGVANSENVELLQLIRLYPEMQAMPVSYFFLEAAFVHRDIPHLEFREDFPDVINGPQYVDRLEQIPASGTTYDQIKYDLKKLANKVYTPFEDIWRTIINPMQIDYQMIRWAFQRKRNQSAYQAIKQVANPQGAEKVELFDATSPYHSRNHTAKELLVIFNAFLKTNALPITTVILNPTTFAEYTENTWTKSGPNDIAPQRIEAGGIYPFPGFAGITAIVDVEVEDNKMFAINKATALRLGEGPKVLRRYEDNERDAAVIKIIDFHQHLAVNEQIKKIDRKFGLTINFSTSPPT